MWFIGWYISGAGVAVEDFLASWMDRVCIGGKYRGELSSTFRGCLSMICIGCSRVFSGRRERSMLESSQWESRTIQRSRIAKDFKGWAEFRFGGAAKGVIQGD